MPSRRPLGCHLAHSLSTQPCQRSPLAKQARPVHNLAATSYTNAMEGESDFDLLQIRPGASQVPPHLLARLFGLHNFPLLAPPPAPVPPPCTAPPARTLIPPSRIRVSTYRQAEARRAFLVLCRTHHPDKGGNPATFQCAQRQLPPPFPPSPSHIPTTFLPIHRCSHPSRVPLVAHALPPLRPASLFAASSHVISLMRSRSRSLQAARAGVPSRDERRRGAADGAAEARHARAPAPAPVNAPAPVPSPAPVSVCGLLASTIPLSADLT